MNQTDPKSVATRCLRAWTTRDFATARSLLHDDVTFVGPLGTSKGADAYISGVQRFAQMVKGAEQRRVLAEGDEVCIMYDLVAESPVGTVPTVGWYVVTDGKISSVRAFFDARPFERSAAPRS